jgi:hypothetical protein
VVPGGPRRSPSFEEQGGDFQFEFRDFRCADGISGFEGEGIAVAARRWIEHDVEAVLLEIDDSVLDDAGGGVEVRY